MIREFLELAEVGFGLLIAGRPPRPQGVVVAGGAQVELRGGIVEGEAPEAPVASGCLAKDILRMKENTVGAGSAGRHRHPRGPRRERHEVVEKTDEVLHVDRSAHRLPHPPHKGSPLGGWASRANSAASIGASARTISVPCSRWAAAASAALGAWGQDIPPRIRLELGDLGPDSRARRRAPRG